MLSDSIRETTERSHVLWAHCVADILMTLHSALTRQNADKPDFRTRHPWNLVCCSQAPTSRAHPNAATE